MLLPSLISLRYPLSAQLSPEDIFSSTLGGIFTDDLQNQHGDDPDTVIVYKSKRFGELEFRTAEIDGEEQRRKFAHYLWNAGILMAELVSGSSGSFESREGGGMEEERGWWVSKEEEKFWSVKGETVLELGAGVGLAGIASVLAGAEKVTISDYPAPPILKAITVNASNNISPRLRDRVTIQGHEWGDFSTPFAQEHAHHYTRILAADCLWMPQEHENLAKSMSYFLANSPDARIFCIAGFHTGRAKIAPFFEEVVPATGLEVEEIYEMDADGRRRAWAKERDGGREHVGERKKWLTISRIRRRVAQ